VYQQAPNPNPLSLLSKEIGIDGGHRVETTDDTLSKKHFQEIHLGAWLDSDDPLCHFTLLAHVTDPDPKDDAAGNSEASEEQNLGSCF
jgi:hypothetical protein